MTISAQADVGPLCARLRPLRLLPLLSTGDHWMRDARVLLAVAGLCGGVHPLDLHVQSPAAPDDVEGAPALPRPLLRQAAGTNCNLNATTFLNFL